MAQAGETPEPERMAPSNVLRYAVERSTLPANPLGRVTGHGLPLGQTKPHRDIADEATSGTRKRYACGSAGSQPTGPAPGPSAPGPGTRRLVNP